jgi:hypothetical protein
MNSLVKRSIALGTAAMAIGVGFAITAPHDGQPEPDICTTSPSQTTEETPFLIENEAAMEKMMNDMAAKPTGNVDADFVAMMVPHHQGAIDMAVAVLRYGHNAQIRRLAQEIIVTQQQEIAAMRLAVGQPLPPSAPSPTQVPLPSQMSPKGPIGATSGHPHE